MGRRKRNEPYLVVFDEVGAEILQAWQNGHIQIVARYRGREFRCTVPTSASDWRGPMVFRTKVRRICATIDAELGGQK
jgi:hypothetical protein